VSFYRVFQIEPVSLKTLRVSFEGANASAVASPN
jgi:hypothetical protein